MGRLFAAGALAAALSFVSTAVVVAGAFTIVGGADRPAAAAAVSACTLDPGPVSSADLTAEQVANARVIVAVGQRRGVAARGLVVAIATALQESGLRNLGYGDRDSAGLFQQRPSSGWGSYGQVTDPVYAATAFFGGPDVAPANPGLLDLPGWERLPVTVAAQAVQRSAFPTAYARHEAVATAVVRRLVGSAVDGCRPLARGPWVLPVPPESYRLTSRFGPRIHPVRRTRDWHTGLDFAAASGSTARSATAGRVLSAGRGGGYGILVKVAHADGVQTWYAHLSRALVRPGQQVAAGSAVGLVGSTGNSTGPHLHFEVRVRGEPTDPGPWLRRQGVAP